MLSLSDPFKDLLPHPLLFRFILDFFSSQTELMQNRSKCLRWTEEYKLSQFLSKCTHSWWFNLSRLEKAQWEELLCYLNFLLQQHSTHLGFEPPKVRPFACVTWEHSLESTSVDLGVQSDLLGLALETYNAASQTCHSRIIFVLEWLFKSALIFKLV